MIWNIKKYSSLQRIIKYSIFIILSFYNLQVFGQIKAVKQSLIIDFVTKQKIDVKQKIKIINTGKKSVDTIYFYAWANAYTSKKTDLSKRFLENYNMNYQFAPKSKLGYIKIDTIIGNIRKYNFLKEKPDILKIVLTKKIKPKEKINIVFEYILKLPSNKFTGYGIDKNKNILLEDFYLSPAPYKSKLYTNKNLNDRPEDLAEFDIRFSKKDNDKNIFSNLKIEKHRLYSKKNNHIKIIITDEKYEDYNFDDLEIKIFNNNNKISSKDKKYIIEKVLKFYKKIYGKFPDKKILITKKDFKNNPVYGFDLLPSFINPYDEKFLWEMSILHQIGIQYADKILIDKRKYPWLYFSIFSYPEYEYLEKYYPNKKLAGKLSYYKLLKFYNFSQLNILEKYPIFYKYMARMNKDQKLSTPLDLMSNFNKDVALPYKSALGCIMLEEEIGKSDFLDKLKYFYSISIKKQVSDKYFFDLFLIDKNHWYYNYISSRQKYNYKIKKIHKDSDSIIIKIKNKRKGKIPLNIYSIKNNIIYNERKIIPFVCDTLIKISNKHKPEWIGLNYFNKYPEIQIRDNFKKVNHSFFGKPLQIRLFQDFENPMKHQIFLNPFFLYNYYDGIILGSQIYNMKVLHNNFDYSISPSYSLKAKTLSGSFGLTYRQYFESLKPYVIKYGINGAYYHYNHNLTYTKINPYTVIEFRNKNLRKRQGSDLALSFLKIDKKSLQQNFDEQNSYSILNLRYKQFKVNILKDQFLSSELQFSDKFGKLIGKYRIRWLTDKTRQWDFRFFAGVFLYNNTKSDYFSFALDRPTDYLFRYNYYGRSEDSGIFQQQFIWAEGGFKTFYKNQFANQWIVSSNMNIGIWKWFNLYGDVAFKKNKQEKANFYYDSGLRINLVQDYFEIFFPVYSNLGNELKSPQYYKKIRLVFTIDLNHLVKMYSRGWY